MYFAEGGCSAVGVNQRFHEKFAVAGGKFIFGSQFPGTIWDGTLALRPEVEERLRVARHFLWVNLAMAALKFGSTGPSAPYLRPTFQVRLLLLVGAAAVVLAMLQLVLSRESFQGERPERGRVPGRSTVDGNFDTTLKPSAEREPLVTVGEESAAPVSAASPAGAAGGAKVSENGFAFSESPSLPGQSSPTELSLNSSQNSSQTTQSASALQEKSLPTRLVLRGIEDNRQVVPSEWPEWLRVFDQLQRADLGPLERAKPEHVTFVQLFDQPEVYRGRLVRTVGYARRAHRVRPPRNDYGIAKYYQVWLQVDDHPADPVALWCLDLPAEFPLGMSIEERVEVVGYFFKLMSYLAADGKIRRAPLILAKTVKWQPRPALPYQARWDLLPLILGAALALTFCFLGWVYYRTRTTSRFGRGRKPELGPLPSKIEIPSLDDSHLSVRPEE